MAQNTSKFRFSTLIMIAGGIFVLWWIFKPGGGAQEPESDTSPQQTHAEQKSSPTALAIAEAYTYLGTPHHDSGQEGFTLDCSALTSLAWKAGGVELAPSSKGQATQGREVDFSDIQLGDLAVFANEMDGDIDHVGLVVKVKRRKVEFIHTSSSKGVVVERLDKGYWHDRIVMIRRVSEISIQTLNKNQRI